MIYLQVYTEASVMSRTAAASTMFRMTNFLIALSFGTHRAQFVHLTGLTWPRLCLQRPPLRRFLVWNDTRRKINIPFFRLCSPAIRTSETRRMWKQQCAKWTTNLKRKMYKYDRVHGTTRNFSLRVEPPQDRPNRFATCSHLRSFRNAT